MVDLRLLLSMKGSIAECIGDGEFGAMPPAPSRSLTSRALSKLRCYPQNTAT
jgi:hypothetical protein